MAHAMFRSDNMAGTKLGQFLVSLKATADIDNGNVVTIGALFDGEREVRTYATPAATDKIGTIAIIGTEEVDATKKFDTVGDFTNKKGGIMRGYILHSGDEFSITADAFETADSVTVAAGTIFELQAKTKLKAVATATTSTTTVGKCMAVEQDGATTWYVIRVD